MAKIQSAKEIFTSYDLLAGEDNKRHPKHEFQAYAYRLASDLDDVKNLQIYMRLAKNVERTLLEQAYSYCIDSNATDKGRVFLWKVKEIRKEITRKKITSSFDYETIIAQTTTLRNTIAAHIIANNEKTFWKSDSKAYKFLLPSILANTREEQEKKEKQKSNVLVIGLESLSLLDMLLLYPIRLFGIDWSREIVRESKDHIDGTKISPRPKLIGKDVLQNSYEDTFFDLIIMNSLWSIIPFESEHDVLHEMVSKLAIGGKIIIGVSQSSTSKQAWNTFNYNNQDYLYFQKLHTEKDFVKMLFQQKLEVDGRFEGDKKRWYVLKHQKPN